MFDSWKKEFLCVTAVFLALIALFYYPAVFQNKLIYTSDLVSSDLLELNVPRRYLVAQAIKRGEIPLWEPRIGNGTLMYAEGHPGTFYPTTLPFYAFLPITAATNLSILSTLLVALWGGYWLARIYGCRPGAALIGALAFGLGGTFLFRLKNLNIIQIIAWLPASLALIKLWWQRKSYGALLALVFVWAIQMLAGHPQAAFICLFTDGLYIAVLWLSSLSREDYKLAPLGLLVLSAILAVALSLVQLAPTYEFSTQSTRAASYDSEYLAKQSLELHHLRRLIQPYCDGNPAIGTFTRTIEDLIWESTPYLGILPLLCLPFAWGRRSQAPILKLAGLALLSLLLAFGPRAGLYTLLGKLCPGFGMFRYPERFIIPMACFASCLAALGAQYIFDWIATKGERAAKACLAIIALLTVADLYAVCSSFQSYLPSDWNETPPCLRILGDDHGRVFAPTDWYTQFQALNGKGWLNNEAPVVDNVQALPPDLAAIWDISSPADYNAMEGGIAISHASSQFTWMSANLFNATFDAKTNKFRVQEPLYTAFQLNNITHLLTYLEIAHEPNDPHFAKIDTIVSPRTGAELHVYTLAQRLAPIRLVPRLVPNVPTVITRGIQPMPNTDDSLYEPDFSHLESIGKVTVLQESNNTLALETECAQNACLVLSRTYHPDWKAYIDDGPPLDIIRVNYAFQGLEVPPGNHRITLRFQSPVFSWSWKVSLSALALYLVGLGWLLVKGRGKNTNTEI